MTTPRRPLGLLSGNTDRGTDGVKASIAALARLSLTPKVVDEVDALTELIDDDAALIHEALTSTRKVRRRGSFFASPLSDPSPTPMPMPNFDDDDENTPEEDVVEEAQAQDDWGSTMETLREDVRERLLTAMLGLLNAADATRLKDTVAGIGPIRAAAIVALRDDDGPFTTVHDALKSIGLSKKQSDNLIIANMRHILATAS